MVIGTNSKSTIFETFQTGVREVVRASGLPEEVHLTAGDARIIAKSADFARKVDLFQFSFKPRLGAAPEQFEAHLAKMKIRSQLSHDNGTFSVILPPFEWRQIDQLAQMDRIFQSFSERTLRSRSWIVDVKAYQRIDFNINVLIEEMLRTNASDIHLRAGSPPYVRVDSDLNPMKMPPLSSEDMKEVIYQLGGQDEVDKLEADKEISFQYHLAGIGYLRCSGYIKMEAMGLAIRLIPERPIPFSELNLPELVGRAAHAHRGLFLVCGITGSGKSTTLAALVDDINQNRRVHIITIEDPIEFVYSDSKSIISQRQVGRDTHSFANALRGALREDPDVILVGEMRDRDTIRAALSAASTGHLVFSTLHTTTAVDTVNRIISYFPPGERDVIRQELAFSLLGVCCQRLLRRKGKGRIPCVEVLRGNLPMVRDAIIEGDIGLLTSIIEVDNDMRSFDQHAVELFSKDLITREEAISACADEEAFNRHVSGIKGTEGRKLLK